MADELAIGNQLNLESFKIFLKYLFINFDPSKQSANRLFNLFDQDQDGLLNETECVLMYNWVKKLDKIKFALIIVDMQNDFIDGSLSIRNCSAKQDGLDCIPIINYLIENVKFDMIIYTLDWHPDDHISFFKNIKNYQIETVNDSKQFKQAIKSNDDWIKTFDKVELKLDNGKIVEQILWPTHCVQDSYGAQLHKDLIISNNSKKIYKGINKDCDSYSAFFDNLKENKTQLDDLLKANEIDVLFMTGLAIDYCVGETTKDAINLGYSTIVIEDACKGIDDKSIRQTKLDLIDRGCLFMNSNQINQIVSKNVKHFEIGLQLAERMVLESSKFSKLN